MTITIRLDALLARLRTQREHVRVLRDRGILVFPRRPAAPPRSRVTRDQPRRDEGD